MSNGAQFAWLADGKRMHFHHGPIDLIVEANGAPDEVNLAYAQAMTAFDSVLTDLVGELDLLRSPLGTKDEEPRGTVARTMMIAAMQLSDRGFMTPMIAVAGAVADYILQALLQGRELQRAYVNNGGDIALHLGPNQSFSIGVCEAPQAPVDSNNLAATVRLKAQHNIGGVATSGWRGRSHSLGIADAVTVLAASAAAADVAATLIANAVNLPNCAAVTRTAARDLALDSDLGDQLVTVAVKPLLPTQIEQALNNGACVAQDMLDNHTICAAFLTLQGQTECRTSALADSLVPSLSALLPARSSQQQPRTDRFLRSQLPASNEPGQQRADHNF